MYLKYCLYIYIYISAFVDVRNKLYQWYLFKYHHLELFLTLALFTP